MAMPHCPVCKDELKGNGSIVSPYRCSCGKWQFDFEAGEYIIIEA